VASGTSPFDGEAWYSVETVNPILLDFTGLTPGEGGRREFHRPLGRPAKSTIAGR
jgi:hypothetical protein